MTPAKRKAESKKDTPPAKKAKSEGEGFSLFFGNLNSQKDFDEIKSSLRKFFSKNDLEVADVRLGGSKKCGYVDFASEEDMQKALELNDKKVMGQELKLDMPRSSSRKSSSSGKSSTTSTARIKEEAERAELLAHAAALQKMHALEEQEQQLKRKKQQLELELELEKFKLSVN